VLSIFRELRRTSSNASLQLSAEAWDAAVKQAEHAYQSALKSGITSLACSAGAVVMGTGFLGVGATKWLAGSLSFKGKDSGVTAGIVAPKQGPPQAGTQPNAPALKSAAVKTADSSDAPPAPQTAVDSSSNQAAASKSGTGKQDKAPSGNMMQLMNGVVSFALPGCGQGASQLAGAEDTYMASLYQALYEQIKGAQQEFAGDVSDANAGARTLMQAYSNVMN
jgi:hypothetical protein